MRDLNAPNLRRNVVEAETHHGRHTLRYLEFQGQDGPAGFKIRSGHQDQAVEPAVLWKSVLGFRQPAMENHRDPPELFRVADASSSLSVRGHFQPGDHRAPGRGSFYRRYCVVQKVIPY